MDQFSEVTLKAVLLTLTRLASPMSVAAHHQAGCCSFLQLFRQIEAWFTLAARLDVTTQVWNCGTDQREELRFPSLLLIIILLRYDWKSKQA